MKKSAGLVIIYDNKILLGHPTHSNGESTYTIPKGGIEIGESEMDAAIRETWEEVGLLLNKDQIQPRRYDVVYKDYKNKPYKTIYYYLVYLNEEPKITKKMLQLEEIDSVGFYNYDDADKIIFRKQIDILKHIKPLENDKRKEIGKIRLDGGL
jgi:ADP-ribose pyrophosphatase YjhB (NUDIX family)